MNIYEAYGRLMEERLRENEAHERTLGLVGDLAAGRILPEQVQVCGSGWMVRELSLPALQGKTGLNENEAAAAATEGA